MNVNAKRNLEINPRAPRPSSLFKRPLCDGGFTFTELVAVLAVAALVVGVVLPVLAQSRPRSEQAVCVNNLRLIGQAVLLFNAENEQLDPWWIFAPAGTRNHPSGLQNNAWFQFAWLSNAMPNPKILACPSDALANPASEFSFSPGGLLNPSFRNAAISYFLGLDSSALAPDSVLAGDRHIRPNGGLFVACASGINPVAAIIRDDSTPARWGSGLHGPAGNILLHDGRVEQTSSKTVNRLFRFETEDNGAIHIQLPRPPAY